MVRVADYRRKGLWFDSLHDETFSQRMETHKLSIISGLGITTGMVTTRGRTSILLDRHSFSVSKNYF